MHDWLYAYIYKDSLLIFGDNNKAVASILVFILSAIAHEYILILAFGFFFPLLFCMFGGIGCEYQSYVSIFVVNSVAGVLLNLIFGLHNEEGNSHFLTVSYR